MNRIRVKFPKPSAGEITDCIEFTRANRDKQKQTRRVQDTDLQLFCNDQLQRFEDYRRFMKFDHPIHEKTFSYQVGPKWARIVATRTQGGDKHVICFINLLNGDIHKDDGWKKPCITGKTKGVRGNIFDGNRGASCMNWHGTVYLK